MRRRRTQASPREVSALGQTTQPRRAPLLRWQRGDLASPCAVLLQSQACRHVTVRLPRDEAPPAPTAHPPPTVGDSPCVHKGTTISAPFARHAPVPLSRSLQGRLRALQAGRRRASAHAGVTRGGGAVNRARGVARCPPVSLSCSLWCRTITPREHVHVARHSAAQRRGRRRRWRRVRQAHGRRTVAKGERSDLGLRSCVARWRFAPAC